MPERRFPSPWTAEETDACFTVRDANGGRSPTFTARTNRDAGRRPSSPGGGGRAAHPRRGPAHRRQHRQAAGAAPQAADLNVVVGAVDAGVMMRAVMLWLLLHYQRIPSLRNARGYCARKWMSS